MMPFAATGVDPEIIIPSEVRQRKTYYITYMWNLKITTNELIYKTETDSQRQKTSFSFPKGKRGGGGKLGVWDKQAHITIYKIDKQQGITVQHRKQPIMEKNIHITESLCCTPKSNTML